MAAATGLAAPAHATTPGGLNAFYAQRLTWSGCGSGYQCAKLSVPLDYTKPGGRRIKIAMVRLPATGKKIGSIVLNFGGPGGSGVDTLKADKNVMSAALRRHFDLVSFDPRGVGASAPVRCLTPLGLDAFFAADPTPDNAAEIKRAKAWAKIFAQGCARNSGRQLLAHVGTGEVARDMDVMRATLGEARLTYFGFSYGTYLGARYADLFPTRIRAMVLDGAEDPNQTLAEFGAAQARGFQVARESFLRDCFRAKDCPFARHTVTAAMKRLETLYKRADRAPLRNDGDSRQVNEAILRSGVNQAMYAKASWPYLRQALALAFKGDGTAMLALADVNHGRRPDGTYDNSNEALAAVNCLDHPEQRCAYWPVKGKRFTRKVRAHGSPPIVVVGTTRDPATPYELARRLAGQLENGVLLTHDGDGHTAYKASSSCLDRMIDRYVITARAPRPGACAKV
ncbi:MAG: alpha/beta fold hydrolase [Nonomuraea sp.]|nr:alpha/beta fold hydrolase [Nonomuraea sp.]NUP62395.1 alpha/beta fold hydrolase [Nonomuraea sp.]NUP78391.1 alpha/beta fold hydrolase [Nonomuraea sp.]NUS09750.1 alpha/beta fold hydrolase [Nonomuraea sp.]NUT12456.1 alpha/beta fold hydrolase [Nonomuraea sp.]